MWSLSILRPFSTLAFRNRSSHVSINPRRIAIMASSIADTVSNPIHNSKKRVFNDNGRSSKRRKFKQKPVSDGSAEQVLLTDVRELLGRNSGHVKHELAPASQTEDGSSEKLPELFTEIDVNVSSISSTGDGLATRSESGDHIFVVPFTVPGDKVRAKVVKHFRQHQYTLTDFVRVVEPSTQRDDSLIKCAYFSACSGCQFQMVPYAAQLSHKKSIVEKAYKNFSGLAASQVPAIGRTIGSPLQYGYRTKLTPHFDGPPGSRSKRMRKNGEKLAWDGVPPIGFMMKGRGKTMDIEDCPIGTDAVRLGMKTERARVAKELDKYPRGATLLLRESTRRLPTGQRTSEGGVDQGTSPEMAESSDENIARSEHAGYSEEKTCITDPNGTSIEYVSDFKFSNPSNAFFQNNNSILPTFTSYIREHILGSTATSPSIADQPRITYLIDAYCGSGLFTITLSSLFTASMGIDISASSISCARDNARESGIPNATFQAADAAALFASVTYPPSQTAVVLDPPRKGCDQAFLSQLLAYAPQRIVYVSCNVHTQARDVGILVAGTGDVGYAVESLRGFDFFPQTGHVEGVAVLQRRDREKGEAAKVPADGDDA